jgi:hypothetical protein
MTSNFTQFPFRPDFDAAMLASSLLEILVALFFV